MLDMGIYPVPMDYQTPAISNHAEQALIRLTTRTGRSVVTNCPRSKISYLRNQAYLARARDQIYQAAQGQINGQMTIESPMAIIRQNGGSVYDGVYKDNCAPNMLQCAADHSLQMDLNISVYSPNSQHMYESDIAGANIKDPLLSPTSSSVCSVSSPLDSFDFDLKPQFEQSKDIFPCVSRASELDWGYPNPMCGGDPHMGSSILGLNMEDIIQVEEMDLNHGPTLAQLNSADSVSPFDDGIDLDEVSEICKTATRIMPMPTMAATSVSNTCFSPLTKCNTNCTATVSSPMDTTLPASCNSSILASNCLQQTPAPVIPEQTAMAIPASQPPAVGSSCLQELLMKKEMPDQQQLQPAHNVQSPVMEMLPPAPTIKVASLKRPVSPSSDTSTSTGSIDKKWEDIKHFLHEEQEQAMSPLAAQRPILKKFKTEPQDIAFNPQDEVMGSAKEEVYDSDADDGSGSENEDMIDADSDAESEGSQSSFMDEYVGGGKKDRRYFWQYNTQAKGPKGKRLCKQVEADDPHILNDFEDPVFDPDQNQMRYKHNGKARRGDGNDIGPNPSKLFSLGNELKKLNRRINEMLPVNELPNPARSKTRKEKNKFASRACRLKKKAQHEANKLKLFGLEQEHRQLMSVLGDIKGYIRKNLDSPKAMQGNVSPKLELLIRTNLTEMIAGNTTEYVNTVLDRVAKGEKNGGVVLD